MTQKQLNAIAGALFAILLSLGGWLLSTQYSINVTTDQRIDDMRDSVTKLHDWDQALQTEADDSKADMKDVHRLIDYLRYGRMRR